MASEQHLQSAIIKYLKGEGHSVFKTIQSSRRGISDVIICLAPHGRFLAIEVKIKGNKPSPLQKHYIQEVLDCGGLAMVAYSLEDVKKYLL